MAPRTATLAFGLAVLGALGCRGSKSTPTATHPAEPGAVDAGPPPGCTRGTCQPIALAVLPLGYAREIYVSGATLYIPYESEGRYPGVYRMKADAPSTAVAAQGLPGSDAYFSCIMDDKLYWSGFGAQAGAIQVCDLAKCDATTAPLVPAVTSTVRIGPVCDPESRELVWITLEGDGGATTNTIWRASSTGTNLRRITSFPVDADGGSWAIMNRTGRFSNHRADRLFFQHRSTSPMFESTLYDVSTATPNARPVALAKYAGTIADDLTPVLSNGTTTIGSTVDSNAAPVSVFTVRMLDGIESVAPSTWLKGAIANGVADATHFFGTIRSSPTIPPDAIIRCPLAAPCTAPTVLFRGHEAAYNFAQDDNNLYWTDANPAGQGFTVLKAAK